MKAVRFSVLLPLIHLLVAGFLISSEESRTWNHRDDAWVDEELFNPIKMEPGMVMFDSGMEYRPSIEAKAIMGAELPAFLLVGWYRHPPSRHSLFQTSLVRIVRPSSVKHRKVVLDLILLGTICVQWWLVCRWMDYRAGSRQGFRRLIPGGIITASIVIAAALSPWQTSPVELIAAVFVVTGFCGWIVMFVLLAASGTRAAVRMIRYSPPQAT